jgi:putative nucleotidyltransferase with HDIG domain
LRPTRLLAPCTAVAAIVVATASLGATGALDRAFHDARVRAAEARYEGPVALVLIDQASLRELPGWPWPRSRHAALVRRLQGAGATVIGFDIDFSSSSTEAEDAALAAAVRASGRVVLGAFKEEQRLPGGLVLEYAGLPLPVFAEGAAAVGSILVPIDPDGTVRRAALRDSINGEPIRSFALEVARLHAGVAAERLEAQVPKPARGVLIDYARGQPPAYGYADVLAGRVPDRLLAGRAVLIGASALELQDLRPTPLARLTPGVQVQAHIVDTILRGGGPRALDGLPVALAAAALALPALALARGRRRWLGLAVAGSPAPVGLGGALAAATWAHAMLPPGPFVIAGLTGLLAHGATEWALARLELGRVRTRLRTLSDFGRRADPTRGLEHSVETVLEVVREMLGLERLSVELADGRLIRPAAMEHAARADGAGEVVVPIASAAGARGRLVAAVPRGRTLVPDEAALLEAIAARIGVDSENRTLAADLQAVHLSMVHSLAVAIEMRNAYTGQHCEGVARRAAAVARAFGLDEPAIERIRLGGLLHDIGKIGVPEPILLKPGRFTPEEYEIMKQHSVIGHKIIASLPFAHEVKDYVRHHHERYDGEGYPDGLAGEAISLGARIVAVSDCYEALTTDRPYRARVADREAMAYIRRCAGSLFDPAVVDRLEEVLRAEGVDVEGSVPANASWDR